MTLGEDTPGTIGVRCERLVPGDPSWLCYMHLAHSKLLAPLADAAVEQPAQLPYGVDPVAALTAWEALRAALPEGLLTDVPDYVDPFAEPGNPGESVVDRICRQATEERDRVARGSGLWSPDGREHIPVHLVEIAARDLDILEALVDRLTTVLKGRLHGSALLDRIAEQHPSPLGPSTPSSLCNNLRIMLDTLRPEPEPQDLALLRPLLAPRDGADTGAPARRVLTAEQEAAYQRFAYRIADIACAGDMRDSASFAWRY
ncbi:hypothetical protein ACWD4F_14265 [Streptomyces aureus]